MGQNLVCRPGLRPEAPECEGSCCLSGLSVQVRLAMACYGRGAKCHYRQALFPLHWPSQFGTTLDDRYILERDWEV